MLIVVMQDSTRAPSRILRPSNVVDCPARALRPKNFAPLPAGTKVAFSRQSSLEKKWEPRLREGTAGNGTMLSLDAGDPETVQAVHAKAIEMGGTDDGAPGPRGTGRFYGGYFRDLDGNKLVAFCLK